MFSFSDSLFFSGEHSYLLNYPSGWVDILEEKQRGGTKGGLCVSAERSVSVMEGEEVLVNKVWLT